MTNGERWPRWVLPLAGVVGPPILAIVFSIVFDSMSRIAGVSGYARANLDKTEFAAFAVVLVAFVVAGAWLSRTPRARLVFVLIAGGMSFLAYVLTFLGHVAP